MRGWQAESYSPATETLYRTLRKGTRIHICSLYYWMLACVIIVVCTCTYMCGDTCMYMDVSPHLTTLTFH